MSRRNPVHEDEEEMEFDEEGEFPDVFEALGSFLATDEGDTIATALVSVKDATERIAGSLELQNKILVKILTAISKPVPVKEVEEVA